MNTASPGATSRTMSKPSISSATLSEASIHSVPFLVSRLPITSGRMPFGSRNPRMPWPITMATTAYPPRQRRYTALAAAKMSAGVTRGVPTRCSSEASTLSSTSESEPVLRWRRSSRTSTSVSSRAVGQVAVVAEANAVRGVHVERLRVVRAVRARRRVAHVADADVALELEHVLLLEHVAHQAGILAHEQLAVLRRS